MKDKDTETLQKNSNNASFFSGSDYKGKLFSWGTSYLSKNLSIVVTGSNKIPIDKWKDCQKEKMTAATLQQLLNRPEAHGIGIVGGAVSGNLEVLDIDTKYDLTGRLWPDFEERMELQAPGLIKRFPEVTTPTGGKHLYYRCEVIEGNLKLAQRTTTEEERRHNPHEKRKVLFETRGEGGQVIAPPTIGYSFDEKKEIPLITADEREILLNTARSFDQITEEVKPPSRSVNREENTGYVITTHADYNSRITDSEFTSLLAKHGWKEHHRTDDRIYFTRPGKSKGISADYHRQKRLFKVWSTSTEFQTDKPETPTGVYCILEHGGDIAKALKDLSSKGYGVKIQNFDTIKGSINKLKTEGKSRDEIKKELVYQAKCTDEQAEEYLIAYDNEAGEIRGDFWDTELIKKGNGFIKKITVNRTKFCQFLQSQGIYLFYIEEGSSKYILVKNTDCLLEEVTIEQIKKVVQDYIKSLPEVFDYGTTQDELLEVIYKGADTYFSKGMFEFLPVLRPDFLEDDETTAYLPFKNGIVCITSEDVTLKKYSDLNKTIWRASVTDFSVTLPSDDYLPDGEFYTFTSCICGNENERQLTPEQLNNRFYLFTLMGYILHGYKDPSKPFAVVLAEETDSDEKGGGTGKGLLVQALGKLANKVDIDGKTFDPNGQFAYQRVNIDTRIIAIQDTKKNFNLESLYNPITEGITVQKKHKDEFFIDYKRSPKFIITTNYTIDQSSNSARRRQRVFEFAPFFSPDFTPEQFFGHKLFYGWSREEWNRFYCFMFWCIRTYLDNGILEIQASDSLNRKYIKQKYSDDFLEWFEGYSSNGCAEWKLFKSLYDQFLEVAEGNGNRVRDRVDNVYSSKKFRSGITEAAKKWGFEVQDRRKPDGKREKELRLLKNPTR